MLIRNLIYILQAENYDAKRFLKFAYKNLAWAKLQKRRQIVWTAKARLIYCLALLLVALFFYFIYKFLAKKFLVLAFLVLPFLPLFIVLALFLIWPLDIFLKNRKIKKAQNILKNLRKENKNFFVAGIAGSYGKTSEKEILASILETKFKILKTPDNINTDIGIADFINKNKDLLFSQDGLILEMGAYKIGEIKKICDFVNPDYSVLTGINQSHLERFGSLANIIQAKFELSQNTKKLAVINLEDENINNNWQKFLALDKKIVGINQENILNLKFKPDFGGLEFVFKGLKFETKLLARHNVILILLALRIAEELNLDLKKTSEAIAKLAPIKHRLEPIYNAQTKIWVIDDSYNGNFNGIKSGLEVLAQASGRKVVLTPGLVELGNKSAEVHQEIARLYLAQADLVLLIQNSAAKYIQEELAKNNFKNYIVYKDAQSAHSDLANILKAGDTIIFQNDWPDNYK